MIKPELLILSKTRTEIAQLKQGAKLSATAIANALARDAALAVAVLYQALHISHRTLRSPIITLLQAVMMLGIEPIHRLTEDLPVAENTLHGPHLILYRLALGRAALSSRLGLYIARERRELEPGEISLASLLSTLSELELWKTAPAKMLELERLRQQPGIHPQQAEYLVFDTGIIDLGRTLTEAWGLPELLQTPMTPYHILPPRKVLSLLASQLARHAFAHWEMVGVADDLHICADHLDMDINLLIQDIDAILDEFEPIAHGYYGLPKLRRLGESAALEHRTEPKNTVICMAPKFDWLPIGEHRIDRATNTDDVIQSLMETCYRGLGMDRVISTHLEEDETGRFLVVDHMLGTEYEYDFLHFHLAVSNAHLFGRLLNKPAAVWSRGGDEKLEPLLPIEILRLTGTDRFFCLSLFHERTPLGVLYTGRRNPECALTEKSFTRFKHLGTLTLKKLASLPLE